MRCPTAASWSAGLITPASLRYGPNCSGSPRLVCAGCPLFSELSRTLCLQVYGVFFNMLTATHSMEACEAAFLLGMQWCEAWAGAGRGDVEASEMAIIARQVGWSCLADHARITWARLTITGMCKRDFWVLLGTPGLAMTEEHVF